MERQDDRNAFATTKKGNHSKCQPALPPAIPFIFIPFLTTDLDVSVQTRLNAPLVG